MEVRRSRKPRFWISLRTRKVSTRQTVHYWVRNKTSLCVVRAGRNAAMHSSFATERSAVPLLPADVLQMHAFRSHLRQHLRRGKHANFVSHLSDESETDGR